MVHARRDDPLIPAWRGDELEAAAPPEVEAAYFDRELDAWVLSRHADILAAFQESRLCPTDPRSDSVTDAPDESALATMRVETLEALGSTELKAWREALVPEVERAVAALPVGEAVDLVAAYARPLCLRLAGIVTGVSAAHAAELARRVSLAAADPYDATASVDAKVAEAELRGCFHAGPAMLRDSTFVALSQTMPCLLANAWFALLQHPAQWALVHAESMLTEAAIEELLRYAGLVRILARLAMADVELNGCVIRKGERIILRVVAGNRDPAKFSDGVDVRRGAGHFALGAGAHACVGASLVRMAAVALTRPLVERFRAAELVRDVEWKGGAGFRSPESLWVSYVSDGIRI